MPERPNIADQPTAVAPAQLAGRRGVRLRARLARLQRTLRSERGDTLIEVLVAAMVLALVAASTVYGLSKAEGYTARERARSQADAIAQQNEEQLRSEPATHLLNLNRTRQVTAVGAPYEPSSGYKGTIFTLTERAEAVEESGATTCSSINGKISAPYIRTISEVTWNVIAGSSGRGRANQRVVETGIVNPPPSTELVVKVKNRNGEPLEGVSASAVGPNPERTSYQTATSGNGCSILQLEKGGEYATNADRLGFVDQDWHTNVSEDPFFQDGEIRLVSGIATPVQYTFDEPGAIKVGFRTTLFSGESPVPAEAINAVAKIELMHPESTTLHRSVSGTCPGTAVEEYLSVIVSPLCVFPFDSSYSIYAGSCTANNPEAFGAASEHVQVSPNATAEAILQVPGVIVRVYAGKPSSPGAEVSPSLYIKEQPSGGSSECYTSKLPVTRLSAVTASHGTVPYIAAAYGGGYSICAQWGSGTTYSSTIGSETPLTLNSASSALEVNLYQNSGRAETISTPQGKDVIKKEPCK
ncbi:MAG TPA: hypothetical protein VKU89_10510 [Solirubrobacteraceae bacterium]|nr:hypothetical protein [Solirubrobacteraceae bacterium]